MTASTARAHLAFAEFLVGEARRYLAVVDPVNGHTVGAYEHWLGKSVYDRNAEELIELWHKMQATLAKERS